MSSEATYLLRSVLLLGLFGGALAAVAWTLRRLGVARSGGALEVVARCPLEGRSAIFLVRVGARVLIVGATDRSVTLLGRTTLEALRETPDAVPAPSAHAEPPSC